MIEQTAGSPLYAEDASIIKFNNFWTVELPPGHSLLCTHPFNRMELPFRTLTGLVDVDLYKDAFIQYPAVWLDPAFSGIVPKGTPIAQCIPVPRQALDLDFAELTGDAAARFIEVKEAVRLGPRIRALC